MIFSSGTFAWMSWTAAKTNPPPGAKASMFHLTCSLTCPEVAVPSTRCVSAPPARVCTEVKDLIRCVRAGRLADVGKVHISMAGLYRETVRPGNAGARVSFRGHSRVLRSQADRQAIVKHTRYRRTRSPGSLNNISDRLGALYIHHF